MLETNTMRTNTSSKWRKTAGTGKSDNTFCSHGKVRANTKITESGHPIYPQEQIRQQVDNLDHLDLEGLRSVWQNHYGPRPALRSVQLLRLMLAWRLQAEALGGLDHSTTVQLNRTGPVRAEGLELGIGAILRRHWKGRTIEVVVEEHGFRWDGRTFDSLSAAATAIAGTRWNGPRFFGLRQQQR